jgi:hypothetical protein
VLVRTISLSPSGNCRVGVVLQYREAGQEVAWRACAPTDALKMSPVFDADLNDVITQIRGRMRQGTMWPMAPDQADYITDRIRTW